MTDLELLKAEQAAHRFDGLGAPMLERFVDNENRRTSATKRHEIMQQRLERYGVAYSELGD